MAYTGTDMYGQTPAQQARQQVQERFGSSGDLISTPELNRSLDDVAVNYGTATPGTLQAHAYAQGTNIYLAPGQEQFLPHEAWHVIQQRAGR